MPLHPRSPDAVSEVAGFWFSVNYREAYGMFIASCERLPAPPSCKTMRSSIESSSYNFINDLEALVETVTISPKYQIVIPKLVRERLHLTPGQKVQAVVLGDRIELIPVRPARELRGFLAGIDTTVEREEDRE
jgi:AbrB family looped-hinge helix DNA binding protein